MTEEKEIQRNSLSIPDYVASRGARLEGILGRVSDAPLREGTRLALLKNGPDTYDDWLAAIAGAERWIHLDNYIFADDEIGNRFADALSAKAKEGVRVRVLHDWFGCAWTCLVPSGGACGRRVCRSRRSTRPHRDHR